MMTTQRPRVSKKPLKQNPFTSYRDPVTGEWIIIKTPPKNH